MTTITITKALTTSGNLYSLNGTYTITINGVKITENSDKQLKDYDNPVGTGSYSGKAPKKTAIDFKWYKEMLEIQGHLMVSDGTYSSYQQKNILKAMMQQGGPVTIIVQTHTSTATSQTNEPLLYNNGSGDSMFLIKAGFTDVRTNNEDTTDTDATQTVGHEVVLGFLLADPMGSS